MIEIFGLGVVSAMAAVALVAFKFGRDLIVAVVLAIAAERAVNAMSGLSMVDISAQVAARFGEAPSDAVCFLCGGVAGVTVVTLLVVIIKILFRN